MKISVAIAACRGGRFIGAQLASIAAQSRLPDEVIICDDGPDEATALAVRQFSGELPLTYQINPVPLGVTGNFNKVLSLSANTTPLKLFFTKNSVDRIFDDMIGNE